MNISATWSRLAVVLCLAMVLGVPTLVGAQPEGGLNSLIGGPSPLGGGVVTVTAEIWPSGERGRAELVIAANVKSPWHIYSITQPPGGPVASTITLNPSSDYRVTGDYVPQPAPDRKKEPVFDNLMVESHHGTVTWRAPLEVAPGVDLATLKIDGVLKAMACDENSACLPPREFPFSATLRPGASSAPALEKPNPPAAMAIPPAAHAQVETAKTSAMIAPATTIQPIAFDLNDLHVAANEEIKSKSLWVTLATAFLGGLILNVMPCVLPVIGLKVLSFVEQAGHSRQHALLLNIWYALGMMVVFMVLASLAVFAHYGWGQLAQFGGFNITLATVVFAMALSFLGVWEVPIPGFVGSGKAVEWGQKEGVAGAFSKGVLTTILATPCSAPFLGPALAWSAAQPPALSYAVFGAVGFGMASPYLLLGIFPELLRFFPKPGAWMETFKQCMGFVLLGTVVFLLTIISWGSVVATVGLLFGLWASCWWVGRVRATASFETKVRAWVGAVAFAIIVWVAMFPGVTIDGVLSGQLSFRGLAEVMQDRFERGHTALWRPFSRARLEEAVAAKKTVVIDFTADWCLTCKTLEAYVLDAPPLRRAWESSDIVTLRADWTQGDPEVTEMLEALGSKQVPVIAVFPAQNPTHPIVFRGGYTQEGLLEALKAAGP